MQYARDGMRANAVAPGVVYTPQDTPKEVMEATASGNMLVTLLLPNERLKAYETYGAEWRADDMGFTRLEQITTNH